MSTQVRDVDGGATGFPELTPLGKRIEHLRVARGLSKQHLARHAGTSRQQLWRVMTGKSELTPSLRQRLAEVLQADPRTLVTPDGDPDLPAFPTGFPTGLRAGFSAAVFPTPAPASAPAVSLAEYLAEPSRVRRTLDTLPTDAGGRALKRLLLNALEEEASRLGTRLPAELFELRRQVVNGEA